MLRSALKVSELAKGSSNEYLIKLANEQIKTIDTLIRVANKDGKDRLVYDLPLVVDTTSMSQADAQLILYARIVKAYADSEFSVSLAKPGKLTIKWSNNLHPDERESLQQYLKNFVIDK